MEPSGSATPTSSIAFSPPRFGGKLLTLGGRTFTVPPLGMKKLRDLLPRLEKLQSAEGITQAEQIDTVIEAAVAAIQRNYPDVTAEELLELVDLSNVGELFAAVMGRDATGKAAES
jgi:hypothetical protein